MSTAFDASAVLRRLAELNVYVWVAPDPDTGEQKLFPCPDWRQRIRDTAKIEAIRTTLAEHRDELIALLQREDDVWVLHHRLARGLQIAWEMDQEGKQDSPQWSAVAEQYGHLLDEYIVQTAGGEK